MGFASYVMRQIIHFRRSRLIFYHRLWGVKDHFLSPSRRSTKGVHRLYHPSHLRITRAHSRRRTITVRYRSVTRRITNRNTLRFVIFPTIAARSYHTNGYRCLPCLRCCVGIVFTKAVWRVIVALRTGECKGLWLGRRGVNMMVNVSMNKDAAGVVKIRGGDVRSPVFIGTASPIASLFKTFNGCVCSGKVALPRVRVIVLANIKDTFVSRPLCNLPATGASRFLTGNLKTGCATSLRGLVIMDVKAKASFMGIRKPRVRRVNNVNVKNKALLKLSHLLLGARSVRLVTRVTQGKALAGVSLRVRSVYGEPLPSLPLSTATSGFKGTSNGTSPRSVTSKVVRVILRSVNRTTVLSTLGDPVHGFILVNGLARLPRYGRVFPGLRRVCNIHFLVPGCSRCEATVNTTLACVSKTPVRPVGWDNGGVVDWLSTRYVCVSFAYQYGDVCTTVWGRLRQRMAAFASTYGIFCLNVWGATSTQSPIMFLRVSIGMFIRPRTWLPNGHGRLLLLNQ